MQVVIAVLLAAAGIYLFWRLARWWSDVTRPVTVDADEAEVDRDIIPEEAITGDGIVYMFAEKFVQPAPSRPIGSIPRDRAYCPTSGEELDPRDYAQQLIYTAVVNLYTARSIKFRLVERDATFMPPFPHKTWELYVQRLEPFEAGPIADSLGCAFDVIYKSRLKGESRGDASSADGQSEWVSMDELIEQALKAIRQEMGFWEKGSVYSDFRNYVGTALLAQGYMLPPAEQTILDRVRQRRPSVNEKAIEAKDMQARAEKLCERLETFQNRFGSSAACEDPKWPAGEVDPGLLNPAGPLEDLPLDDCLRVSIYETLIAIRQLEPSGEAGV